MVYDPANHYHWYRRIIAAHVILMIGCPLAMSPSQTHALNSLEIYESADGSTPFNRLSAQSQWQPACFKWGSLLLMVQAVPWPLHTEFIIESSLRLSSL